MVVRELFVISRMDLGGAERIVVQLCAAAVARGDHAAVCSSGGEWVSRIESLGVTHHPLPRMRRNPLRIVQAVWRLRRIIGREQPDVVHAVNVKVTAVAYAALGRRGRRRVPLVTSMHGVPAHEYAKAASVLQRRSTRIIACAPAVERHLVEAGLAADRIDVVTNAVGLEPADDARRAALRERVGAPAGSPLVVGVGRLVEQKDWPTWLAVAAQVPEAWFALAGDGPLRPDLQRLADQAGNVSLLGRVDDVPALHGIATLFLSTSLWEGLPLALLEAMSLGVPSIVTAVDGVTDAVPATAAVFVATGDVAGTVEAVRALLTDPMRREALSAAGSELPGAPGADEMVAGYERVHRRAADLLHGAHE